MSLGTLVRRVHRTIVFINKRLNNEFDEVTFCGKDGGKYTCAGQFVDAKEIGKPITFTHPITETYTDAIRYEITKQNTIYGLGANAACYLNFKGLDSAFGEITFQPLRVKEPEQTK